MSADTASVSPTVSRGSGHPVLRFLAGRTGAAIATLLVASILIFVGTEVLPGDVATAILGRNSTPAAVSDLRDRLDLNRPATERYFSWLGGFLKGDLGESATGTLAGAPGASVWSLISERIVNTLILAGATLLVLVPLALTLGVLAALYANRFLDHALSIGSIALIALPEFVTAAVLILLLAGWWKLLPAVSFIPSGSGVLDNPKILILPVLTLLAASVAQLMRMVRAGMLDVLGSPFVESARLAGVRERRVILQYGLRNALAPTVQVVALTVQWLIGGIIITEYVFGYPGLGASLVNAVNLRDVPYVQSVALLIAIVYVGVNIVADLVVIYLVPKLRTAQFQG